MLQCVAVPPGTGKSHVLLAAGHATVGAGMQVRYFATADLIESLYPPWPAVSTSAS